MNTMKIVVSDMDAYEKLVQTKLSLISELGNVHSYIAIKKGKQTTKLDLKSVEDVVK